MEFSMDLDKLLGNSFACECGKRHEVPVRAILYQDDAVQRLPDVLGRLIPGRRAAIIADARTWDICGARAQTVLRQAGWACVPLIIKDQTHCRPSCDDMTVAALKSDIASLTDRPDIAIAVGGGTINDLTKWSAFDLGLPYSVVATAASMNGYSAANVAPTVKGVKVLVRAAAPIAVMAEPSVIEGAPSEMTAAGFGDAIAKCMSGADWLMNNHLFGEHYCPMCSRIVEGLEGFYLKCPEDVRQRQPAAIEGLFRGLFWSGVAMTMIGTSVPASGGEHLLSHTLDMMAGRDGIEHDLHGRQVGVGTIFSAALYERLMAMDVVHAVRTQADIDAGFWKSPMLVHTVREQWQAKQGDLGKMRYLFKDGRAWQELKARLMPAIRSPREVKGWLPRAGAASTNIDIGCTRDRLRDALLHMHEIRRRCTVVDLAWAAGVMPDIVDEIMVQWLER
jgi:glycerol-1-phosphate dehydrogenase [NAD(P)+]